MQSYLDQLLFCEPFVLPFLKQVKQCTSITELHQSDNNSLTFPTNNVSSKILNDMLRFWQYAHYVFFLPGFPKSLLCHANDSFESELFFGFNVFSEPYKTESTLGEKLNLMDLSSCDIVFLRSVCVVVLLRFAYLLLNGVFDLFEHILKVWEHIALNCLFKFKVLLF